MSDVIAKIAAVSIGMSRGSGTPASEIAGLIVSFLAANPEHTERFMSEGIELFIDGTIRPEFGCLSYTAANGETFTPKKLRENKGMSQ